MKLQNTFTKGIIDKDSDSRFVDSAMLIDAENFFVNTVDGSSNGIGKNALGNALKTAYAITGAKTMGHGVDSSSNLLYNFIKGTTHDYIIEYNALTSLSQIVLQSATGTRLNFKTGERIINVDVISSGLPYDVVTQEGGNLLAFSGDSNPPRIININRAKTWGVDGFTAEEIMLVKAPPLYPVTTVQVNTIAAKENFMEERFLSFSYRYKYKDGYYSAISSWQEYAFTPGKFNLDFATFENKGMRNIFNACDISFNVGGREVIAVDLLFKESNSSVVYKVDQFVKKDENWNNNSTQSIKFSNNKIYSVLPEDQYFRSFDNIPESVVAQTQLGNRIGFANYKDGKDLIDKDGNKVVMDYSLQLLSNEFSSSTAAVTQQNRTSSFADAVTIVKGKLSVNFTGVELKKNAVIYVVFNIKANYVTDASPTNEDTFIKTYSYILPKDYATIQSLVVDASNGFKDNIEGYFSEYLKTSSLQTPFGTMATTFNGFTIVASGNTLDITLPSVKYEIDKSPSANTFVYVHFTDVSSTVSSDSIGSKKSLKSYRSYEICQIYRDAQGRKTTALTSANNTLFVPVNNSVNQNQIQVTIPMGQKPPKWATTYKFGIKENRGLYEEVYCSIFYKDGGYRWIKLEGSNKNKINEGDVLLVKKDIKSAISSVVKTKVLEVKYQEADFIADNKDRNDKLIVESAGFYMKVKPENFTIDYNENEFNILEDNSSTQNDRPFSYIGGNAFSSPTAVAGEYEDVPITIGSVFDFKLKSNRHNDDSNRGDYYEKQFIANDNYPSIVEYYNAELADKLFTGVNGGVYTKTLVKGRFTYYNFERQFVADATATGQHYIRIEGTASGNGNWSGFLWAELIYRSVSGFFVFETLGKETDNNLFFETPEVFNITAGAHDNSVHLLDKTFNCYAQGNGSESHQIQDTFNEKYISIDFNPTAISQNEYKQENRFADITYSGTYNSSSNVNRLNEFNLYLANFKDDIDKSYGPIYKIKGVETNLQVCQEDKDSQVFYGKDILYNADGSSNLTKIEDVLGVQDTYIGEFGISTHPESYDIYAGTTFHTDLKRGVVLKKINNGLHEISKNGMRSYFKKLFRDNVINQVLGKYDQYHDVYVLNVKYNSNQYVTWVYSDDNNGWLGRITFNPEDMCRVNSKFFSFKNGEIYEHNQSTGRNTFYGIESPSTFSFNFSQLPSERKTFKTVEMEATDSWQLTLKTDIDKGFINNTDFVLQEGVHRAYTRTSNDVIDSAILSCQGVGNCTVSGLVLSFGFDLESEVSIGDQVRNANALLVGTILSKTARTLTLDTVNNLVSGEFVLCSKSQSSESAGLLGYHMEVTATLSKNTKTEVYAVNTETSKSYT